MLDVADQKLLLAALDAIQNRPKGPTELLLQLQLEYSDSGREFDADTVEPRLWALLTEAPLAHDVVQRLGRLLRWFDNQSNIADWASGTVNNTSERRQRLYEKLAFPASVRERMDDLHRVMSVERPILISDEHEKWYTEERKNLRAFYWRHLENYLREEWNDEGNLQLLDRSSDEIVSRLSDPLRKEAHAVRGLVVGYVQSGKTANFTSVIAKSIDAGYRLILVLAGQWDILRQQTQRRLDKELCGKQNVVRYAPGDAHDYFDDKEWNDFVDHGGEPSEIGGSDIVRLTTRSGDYYKLAQGIAALEMVGAKFPDRPFNDAGNIFASPTKIAVIKKNAAILDRLIGDLEKLQLTALGEVPVLIIDDESDQASVNTKKPPTEKEQIERTAINQRLVKLLSLFKRGQYVGYTATPFANVFVDPEDQEDIYPRHFIYALERPLKHYMGVRDFFDVDDEGIVLEEKDAPAGYQSNQRAYVRAFTEGKNDDRKLIEAIQTFVLTGAVKLYREELGEIKARHHTMLVHRSQAIADHKSDSQLVQKYWDDLDFGSEAPHEALEELFETSIRPVSAVKAPELSLPDSYEQLRPYVNRCIRKIESQEPYVRIINGTKQSMEEAPAFEDDDIWSILVGGTKLSRGYTVEGLTVSYFMRRSQTIDTLMQMGRWFGFRKGYRDLVRVYLQRGSIHKKRDMDLVAAFRAACMDEEALRSRLDLYKEDDIRPIDVAPVVQSHLLMPVAKNKRYNAELKNANLAGRWKYTTVSERAFRESNVRLFSELVKDHSLSHGELGITWPGKEKPISTKAIWTALEPGELIDFIRDYQWPKEFRGFDEVLIFLRGKGEWDPEIDRWLLLAPQVADVRPVLKVPNGSAFKCVERKFLDEKRFDAVTTPAHRLLAEFVAMVNLNRWSGNPEDNIKKEAVKDIFGPRQGVCLIYPVLERGKTKGGGIKDSDITISVSLLFPGNRIKKRVAFSVVDASQKDKIVVDT